MPTKGQCRKPKKSCRKRKRASKKQPILTIKGQLDITTNTWTSEEIVIPNAIVLSEFKSGSAFGIEVLKIDVIKSIEEVGQTETIFGVGIKDFFGETDTPAEFLLDKSVIWSYNSGATNANASVDLTDDYGNGPVVPGTALFLNGINTGNADANWTFTITYRMKNLSTSEYVTMVNSYLTVQ